MDNQFNKNSGFGGEPSPGGGAPQSGGDMQQGGMSQSSMPRPSSFPGGGSSQSNYQANPFGANQQQRPMQGAQPGMMQQGGMPQPMQQGQFNQPQPSQQPQQPGQQGIQPGQPGQSAENPLPAKGGSKSGNTWKVVAIIFIIISLILGGAFGWALVQYIDYRNNTSFKISQAVASSEKNISLEMQKKFEEEAKSPYTTFVGPDDYGRVSFEYPKTWNVYVSSEVSSGTSTPYKAFFYPEYVPPVSDKWQFALRMTIEDVDYDKVVGRYQNQVKKNELSTSPIQVGLLNGTRLDGFFSEDIRGAAVIFKVRDKTLTLRTDSNTYMADFDKLVQTIQVNE